MDEDEIQVLKLNPKFWLFPKITLKEIRKQGAIANHKARWDQMNRIFDEKGNEIVMEKEEKKTMEQRIVEEEHREVFNPQTKTVDFRKVRASDVKNNPRAIMAKPTNVRSEAEFEARRQMVEDTVNNFLMEHPEPEKNLTPSEYRGLVKLKKRVANKELVVYQTDKSSKLAVASLESYTRQGQAHTKADKQVG